MNWCQPQIVSSVADIRVWDVKLFKQAPGLKYNVRTAVHLLISPTGLVEWLSNGYIPLLTPCNVCGMVGVDKHKSSEDLISTYCVYSEAMMVGVRGSYYFIKRGWGRVNNDVHRGGKTWLAPISRHSFTNKCYSKYQSHMAARRTYHLPLPSCSTRAQQKV